MFDLLTTFFITNLIGYLPGLTDAMYNSKIIIQQSKTHLHQFNKFGIVTGIKIWNYLNDYNKIHMILKLLTGSNVFTLNLFQKKKAFKINAFFLEFYLTIC